MQDTETSEMSEINLLDNKYITPILVLFTTLYVTIIRPTLPKYIENLFNNFFFRLCVLSFILYKATNDMQTSVLVTFCFLYIMHMVNTQQIERCINGKSADKKLI